MKRVLLALVGAAVLALAGQSASAADLPAAPVYKAPPAAVVHPYNWSGFYIGAHLGYHWANVDVTPTLVPGFGTASPSPSSFTFGGHLGWLYQMRNNMVLGVEGDWSWLNGSNTNAFNLTPAVSVQLNTNWDGSIRAILGFAADRTLFYVTGGWGWANGNGCGVPTVGPAVCIPGTAISTTVSGWTAGAGIAYAFTDNLFARLEYLYADYGTTTLAAPGFPGGLVNISPTASQVRLGLSWKFGGNVY